MKNVMLSICLILLACSGMQAQDEETLFDKTGLRLSGIWIGPAGNLTKFGDDYAYLAGGYGGLEFNNSVLLGWGGYHLRDGNELDGEFRNLEMKYKGGVIGYNFNSHKVIHPKLMLLVGGGQLNIENRGNSDKIFVLQPSAGVDINVFRWFHLGLEGGYRVVSDTALNGLTDSDVSGFFGGVSFKFGWSWGW